jgi:ABC-type multidrug transport system fused ATPase/permease subunit
MFLPDTGVFTLIQNLQLVADQFACRQSENVLRGISLSIEAGQKIGICGRTGR